MVVGESVERKVVAWWIELGEKDGVKKTQSHKSKKMFFSLKPLFPSFPFFSLFPTLSFPDSLLLSHHPLSITQSTSLFTHSTCTDP